MPAWTRATVQHGSYRRVDCAGLCAPLVVPCGTWCVSGTALTSDALGSPRRRGRTPHAFLGVVFTPRGGGMYASPLLLPLSLSLSVGRSPSLRRAPFLRAPLPPFPPLVFPPSSLALSPFYSRSSLWPCARTAPRIHARTLVSPRPSSARQYPLLSLPPPPAHRRLPSTSAVLVAREITAKRGETTASSLAGIFSAAGGRGKARFFQNATLPSFAPRRERGGYDFSGVLQRTQEESQWICHPAREDPRMCIGMCARKRNRQTYVELAFAFEFFSLFLLLNVSSSFLYVLLSVHYAANGTLEKRGKTECNFHGAINADQAFKLPRQFP